MGISCNNVQGISTNGNCGCGCDGNNSITIILAAIIALILVNILDEDASNCIGQFLQSIGELMALSTTNGCLSNFVNNSCCNYY
ncbi:MAG: hypothetical protein E7231_07000 [Cellulosilyticum sp.]|nr:hypothetical protein [Cellulosilyticum sp.]